jgi:hypothetical protein
LPELSSTVFNSPDSRTDMTSSVTMVAPKRSACFRISAISSGPVMPRPNPGKFSTSVVFINAPPELVEPSIRTGFSRALAA